MEIASGRVVDGKVVLDSGEFPEGTNVTVVAADPAAFDPTPDEEVLIREGIAQAEEGKFISVEDLFERLRKTRGN